MKQQFNVYLSPELVNRVKHRAIDESLSLSALVTKIFDAYLSPDAMEKRTQMQGLQLQPIVHTGKLDQSIAFYEALGASVQFKNAGNDWAQLSIGAAEIGLLAHPPNPEQGEDYVKLCFTYEDDLFGLEKRLRGVGITIVRGTADEAFGQQLQIESPEGMLIKINRIERDLLA